MSDERRTFDSATCWKRQKRELPSKQSRRQEGGSVYKSKIKSLRNLTAQKPNIMKCKTARRRLVSSEF